jgi:hypothetical protein
VGESPTASHTQPQAGFPSACGGDARERVLSRSEVITLAGFEPPPPGLDSLLGDEDEDSRGPEWCVDLGDEMRAMNKFELWLALGTGDFAPTTLVWRVGRERWQPARDIPDLACALKVHAQSLQIASLAARQAANEGGPSRVLTPQNSALVLALDDENAAPQTIDADTPDAPNAAAAMSAAPPSRTPKPRRSGRGRNDGAPKVVSISWRARLGRVAMGVAAAAGLLLFVVAKGDAKHMTGALASSGDASPTEAATPIEAAKPDVPSFTDATGQSAAPGSSVVDASSDPPAAEPESSTSKPKKHGARRAKDGVARGVAGVEADRRGRARQHRR